MSKQYEEAQIYLTVCTHPDYKSLRYLGLDTKCDPNYYGSSVVLKWWIQLLGRKYFQKTILKTITGTMSELCAIEQRYIVEHDAVRNPHYFNMNGGKANLSAGDHAISMEFAIAPVMKPSQDFVNGLIRDILSGGVQLTHNRRQLLSRFISMCLYGYLKYEQEDFEFSRYTHYGSCNSEDTQYVIAILVNAEIIDSGGSQITITEKFIEKIPMNVYHTHFKCLVEK